MKAKVWKSLGEKKSRRKRDNLKLLKNSKQRRKLKRERTKKYKLLKNLEK